MKIFVSGATGVVGRRAVRALVEDGHEVTAMARTEEKARLLETLGARPVQVSLFDGPALERAIAGHDVVVNLATSVPPATRMLSPETWATNDRIRREGSRTLAGAALAAGALRFVQESITFPYADGGSSWLDESSPVEPTSILGSAMAAEASAARFTAAGGVGVVLRFGAFYGPDSDHTIAQLRSAKMRIDPLPGNDNGYVSTISTDDAAGAVVAALRAPAGIYNVVDDHPMTRLELDRALADALGVRRVRRPAIVAALGGRKAPHLTRSQRVSNRRFREATGWAPRYPSIVEGLPPVIAASPVGPKPKGGVRTRTLLGLLALGGLVVGAWAQFAPHSFYTSFPGGGRAWVAADGPFNEHLIRDVGGLNLALTLLTIAAAVSLGRGLVRTAGGAWVVYGLPHLAYHAAHLAPLAPADRLANVVALAGVVVAGLVLLGWPGASEAGEAAAIPEPGQTTSTDRKVAGPHHAVRA